MKRLFILSILLSTVILSCNKDPDPEPEVIRAYCLLYHFIPQMSSVVWEVDGIELPNEQSYAYAFQGSITLDETSEEIEFAVKHPGTNDLIINQLVQLEENTYYNVIVCGPAQEPSLIIEEIETSFPAAGMEKIRALHSIQGQGPVDFYIGDTTLEERVISALDYLELSDPFEVSDSDMRKLMAITAHSNEYSQDSVLLTSDYNEITSGANYLTVVAPYTYDTTSKLTFWLYGLPLE